MIALRPPRPCRYHAVAALEGKGTRAARISVLYQEELVRAALEDPLVKAEIENAPADGTAPALNRTQEVLQRIGCLACAVGLRVEYRCRRTAHLREREQRRQEILQARRDPLSILTRRR